MTALTTFVAFLLLQGAAVELLPQALPGQPRDPRAAPTAGTGVIKGRVTAADTGAPFRRAIVQLNGGPRPRAVYADDDGRYVFDAVAPGSYSVSANPGMHRANYRQSVYGADPSRPTFTAVPSRIRVAEGQVLENIDIAIPRSGAIVGRVVDPYGEPAARIQVRLLMMRPGQEPMQTGPGGSTDDLGQFRVFGVAPGDYLVLAEAQPGGPVPELEGERLGFARTFAPGVYAPGDAARVRVGPGTEALVEIRLLETAVFNLRGTVLNARGEPARNANVSIMRSDFMASGTGSGTDQSGAFTIRNVTPGSYDLVVQVFPGDGRPGPTGMAGREMASLKVDVTSADIEGLQLMTAPGASFTGEVVFDDAAPQGARVQLNLLPAQLRSFGPPGSIVVKDQAFSATDVFGPVLIRGNVVSGGPRPAGSPPVTWTLKEVLLNGRDVTDVPTVFTAAHSGRLQVVFTSRTASVEGRALDDAGKPVRGAMIMAFSGDEEHWTFGSSRVRSGMASGDGGEFAVRGLRSGRYYVVAVEAGGPIGTGPSGPDREFLRRLKASATEVLLNENETRSVDLRVVRIE